MTKRRFKYQAEPLKELILQYAHEADRIDQKDKEDTQKLIVLEVYARIKDVFDLINSHPESAERIYSQFIDPRFVKE